jgi:hypothetical protein
MMHMFNLPLKYQKMIAGFLLVPLLGTSVGLIALAPQQAHAQQTVFDPTNFVANTKTSIESTVSAVMNSLSAAALKSLGLKEWALDGVLFALAKKALQQMVRSTVSWINSGFKGSPMYITNPEQFLTNVGDEIAGEIIYGSDLNFLCSPINIRVALEFYYKATQQRKAPQCTLSGVVKNVDQFVKGNFLAGGWPGWLAVTISPTNQPIGGLLAAVGTLESNVGAGRAGQVMRLNWGKGFLSYEDCTDPKDKSTCKIVTPGSTIADALTFELSVGERTLIEADEINEIIGALFAQLGSQALTSLRGVNGISKPAPFGSGTNSPNVPTGCAALSYLDQLNDPRCNPNPYGTTTAPGTGGTTSFLGEALTAERAYQSLYKGIVTSADSVRNEATDKGIACRANERVFDEATEIRDDATEKIGNAETLITKLLDIEKRYLTGSGDIQLAAINEYIALEGSDSLHSEVSNALEQRKIDDLKASLEALRKRLETCRRDDDEDEVTS